MTYDAFDPKYGSTQDEFYNRDVQNMKDGEFVLLVVQRRNDPRYFVVGTDFGHAHKSMKRLAHRERRNVDAQIALLRLAKSPDGDRLSEVDEWEHPHRTQVSIMHAMHNAAQKVVK